MSPFSDSVLVAVTVRVKSPSLSAGGAMVSADRAQLETSIVVLPMVAVKLLAPSLSVAPTGMAPICTARVSEPSVSSNAGSMARAMAASSSPAAFDTTRAGASETAATETGRFAVVVAVSPLPASVLVAVMVRAKSSPLSAGGVMARVDSAQPETSTLVLPSVAVKLFAPSLRTAPMGMALIRTDKASEPSVSTRAGSIARAIAASSLPDAASVVRLGASAIPATVSLTVALEALPAPSETR